MIAKKNLLIYTCMQYPSKPGPQDPIPNSLRCAPLHARLSESSPSGPLKANSASPPSSYFPCIVSQRTRASPPYPITRTRNTKVVFDFSVSLLRFQSMATSSGFLLRHISRGTAIPAAPCRHQLIPGDRPLSPELLFPKPDFSTWPQACSSLAHSPHSNKGDLSKA